MLISRKLHFKPSDIQHMQFIIRQIERNTAFIAFANCQLWWHMEPGWSSEVNRMSRAALGEKLGDCLSVWTCMKPPRLLWRLHPSCDKFSKTREASADDRLRQIQTHCFANVCVFPCGACRNAAMTPAWLSADASQGLSEFIVEAARRATAFITEKSHRVKRGSVCRGISRGGARLQTLRSAKTKKKLKKIQSLVSFKS